MKLGLRSKNRIFYLDILRVIACLSVIMIHSSAEYVTNDIGSFNFWIGNLFDSLTRIGVPIFVMISGALMLDKNYQYETKKIIKHITRMIVFFVCWSAVYCLIFEIIGPVVVFHEAVSVINIIISFICGYYHLWFAYLIIGLYLIVPLLRLWVKDDNKKYVEYFIILSIIFTYLIPQMISICSNYSGLFEYLDSIIEKLCLKYVGGYTAYFILGWYMHNYDIKKKRIVYILGVLGLIVSIFGTYILSVSTGTALQMYENLSINVLFQSIAIYAFVKSKFADIQNKDNKFLNSVSKYSLGIYAIHAMIVAIMNKIGFDIAIIGIMTIFIVSFLISYLCSIIISKIPLLKKIV